MSKPHYSHAEEQPLLRGLSVIQPWATALVHGPKDVENRSWGRHVPRGGLWLAIHASKTQPDPESWAAVEELWPEAPRAGVLALGVVLGVVRIDWICKHDRVPYGFRSPWANPHMTMWWHVAERYALPVPRLARGKEGLWEVPEHIHGELRELVITRRRAARGEA
ncbi:MAG: hypothetical protein AMXMBFR64_04870 [Myxococcales bacterium]